jgi:uncharacterized protein GlcG (DUF336 family)
MDTPPFSIERSNDGLIAFPGGLPILDKDGVLVAGIGMSGSAIENDHAVALAGVNRIGAADMLDHLWST